MVHTYLDRQVFQLPLLEVHTEILYHHDSLITMYLLENSVFSCSLDVAVSPEGEAIPAMTQFALSSTLLFNSKTYFCICFLSQKTVTQSVNTTYKIAVWKYFYFGHYYSNLQLKFVGLPLEMPPSLVSVSKPPLCNTAWSTED